MASRAETKKKQIEKKAKAANLSVAEYKKAILGQGDSALAKYLSLDISLYPLLICS